MVNSSQVSHFTLGAYFDTGPLRWLYFLILMSVYALIVLSNLLLIAIICLNRTLHEPMYIFLCSLFVNELYGSAALFPFLLVQILKDVHTISYSLCFLQIFCIHSYANVEFGILAVMSYDRYLAICCPLQYNKYMTPTRIAVTTAVLWLYSLITVLLPVSLALPLKMCGSVINKVYCNNFSVVKLSCSDTTLNNVFGVVYMFSVVALIIALIVYSYVRILRVCLSGSRDTRLKAFHTCSPQMASFLSFSFGVFFEVMQSRFDMSNAPLFLRIILSLYFITFQPLLNPIMYGLKLSKVRSAIKALHQRDNY